MRGPSPGPLNLTHLNTAGSGSRLSPAVASGLGPASTLIGDGYGQAFVEGSGLTPCIGLAERPGVGDQRVGKVEGGDRAFPRGRSKLDGAGPAKQAGQHRPPFGMGRGGRLADVGGPRGGA